MCSSDLAYSQYHDSWLDYNNAVYVEDMSDYLESDDENILYVMIYNTAYSVEYISKNISEFYYDVDTSEIVSSENIDTVELETLRFLLDNDKPDDIPEKIWDKLPIKLDTKPIDTFETYAIAIAA